MSDSGALGWIDTNPFGSSPVAWKIPRETRAYTATASISAVPAAPRSFVREFDARS